jgi:hypothetical protein
MLRILVGWALLVLVACDADALERSANAAPTAGGARALASFEFPLQALAVQGSTLLALSHWGKDVPAKILVIHDDGSSTAIVTHDTGIEDLAVDDHAVYFVDAAAHAIVRAGLDGKETVLTSGLKCPMRLARNDHDLYYDDPCALGSDGPTPPGILAKISTDGGTPRVIARHLRFSPILSLAFDATRVYWADNYGSHSLDSDRGCDLANNLRIVSFSKTGGDEHVHQRWNGQDEAFTVQADARALYWTRSPNKLLCKARPESARGVYTAGKAGTTPKQIADAPDTRALMLDGDRLYWIAGTDRDSLVTMPSRGGTPDVLYASTATISAVAFDASSVYWIETDSHERSRIMKAAKPR